LKEYIAFIADASKVSSVSPRYGSLNGGTRITIAGEGK